MTLIFDFPGGRNNYLMTLDGALSEELCEEFLDASRHHYGKIFSPGPTIGGIRREVKSSMDASIDSIYLKEIGLDSVSVFSTMHQKAMQAMYIALGRYRETYRELWSAPGLTDTGFRFQHYSQAEGWYRQHTDGCPWEWHASGGQRQRVIAAIIYLNTVESGGGTKFPEQKQIVSAKAGRVALFSCGWTHPHLGLTPLSSDKFIFSSFITCERTGWDKSKDEEKPESPLVTLKDKTHAEDETAEKDK